MDQDHTILLIVVGVALPLILLVDHLRNEPLSGISLPSFTESFVSSSSVSDSDYPAIDTPPMKIAKFVFDLSNDAREDNGLSKLTWHRDLAAVAYLYSSQMATHDHFAHDGVFNDDPDDRVGAANIQCIILAENLSLQPQFAASRVFNGEKYVNFPYEIATDAVEGLLDSPGHRRNIMHRGITHSGVGAHYGWTTSNDFGLLPAIYITQLFCKPA